ncbi:MAG: aldehyde dehydrogenase family protein [Solirubrobacteraceae bacterium]
MRVGDPRDPTTDLGPLITHAARDVADAALERSLSSGARLVTRAAAPAGKTMFAAAWLTARAEDDPLRAQELFAPVLAVEPFVAVEDALAAADHGTVTELPPHDQEIAG